MIRPKTSPSTSPMLSTSFVALAFASSTWWTSGQAQTQLESGPQFGLMNSGTGYDKRDFANNLLNCARSLPLNECLMATLDDLRPFMPTGIPELGLKPSEPFLIDHIFFKTAPQVGNLPIISLELTLTNLAVTGLSKFQAKHIDADLAAGHINIVMQVPRIDINGHYKADGKVLVINLSGEGAFNSTLTNVMGRGSATIVPKQDSAGVQKYVVGGTNIDFDIGGASVHLDNLFNGEAPALSDSTNKFLNDNSKIIIDVVKPQIKKEVQRLLTSILNDALSKLPVDDLLSKLPRENLGARTHATPKPPLPILGLLPF